jgi:hypothetical protein
VLDLMATKTLPMTLFSTYSTLASLHFRSCNWATTFSYGPVPSSLRVAIKIGLHYAP